MATTAQHPEPKEVTADSSSSDGVNPPPSQYPGSGTVDDPYQVAFSEHDPRNPQNFSIAKKTWITFVVTISVFAVTMTSSAYAESSEEITKEFNANSEDFALGVSLYVLGFAVGPAFWAPMSEIYGRRILFVLTHAAMVAFVGGTAGCQNLQTLLVFRTLCVLTVVLTSYLFPAGFLSGTFAASPLTNSGGVIADLYSRTSRGIPMALFSAAPFLGPNLGPIIGGFVTTTVGWRWVQGVCVIFIGIVWIVGSISVPETYAPIILQRIANKLTKESGGKVFRSVVESTGNEESAGAKLARTLKRPWILLFREPIVLVASTYLAIVYGTIYMLLAAFPIVYNEKRGWSTGIGSLPFLGLIVGMLIGLGLTLWENHRYVKLGDKATPESRIPPALWGAIAMPVGMFAFAWTNSPSIDWPASVILVSLFGLGTVGVFIAMLQYLLDAYTIYAASVMAATAMLRSFFGFAFPLFTTQMYNNLGIHWASSIPAFLVLICVPFPFALIKYGGAMRMKCKYAAESERLANRLRAPAAESNEA